MKSKKHESQKNNEQPTWKDVHQVNKEFLIFFKESIEYLNGINIKLSQLVAASAGECVTDQQKARNERIAVTSNQLLKTTTVMERIGKEYRALDIKSVPGPETKVNQDMYAKYLNYYTQISGLMNEIMTGMGELGNQMGSTLGKKDDILVSAINTNEEDE